MFRDRRPDAYGPLLTLDGETPGLGVLRPMPPRRLETLRDLARPPEGARPGDDRRAAMGEGGTA